MWKAWWKRLLTVRLEAETVLRPQVPQMSFWRGMEEWEIPYFLHCPTGLRKRCRLNPRWTHLPGPRLEPNVGKVDIIQVTSPPQHELRPYCFWQTARVFAWPLEIKDDHAFGRHDNPLDPGGNRLLGQRFEEDCGARLWQPPCAPPIGAGCGR